MAFNPVYVWTSAFNAQPAGGDNPAQGYLRIDESKGAVYERMQREFYWGNNSGSQAQEGNPKMGCGRAFAGNYGGYVTSTTSVHGGLKPDSAVGFDVYDVGRLAFDSSAAYLPRLLAYSKTALTWQPYLRELVRWSIQGTLGTGTNVVPLIGFTRKVKVVSAAFWCKTAPTGANLILNVKKNNSQQIYSTLPSITAGTNSVLKTAAPSALSYLILSTTDYLSLDITQVGAIVPGADLTVAVEVLF
jgi:hypothetical protein